MNRLSWSMTTLSLVTSLTSCFSSKEGGGSQASSSSASAEMLWSKNNFPLTIKVSPDFTSTEALSIKTMGEAWESVGLNFFTMSDAAANLAHSDTNNYRDSELGVYILDTWPTDFSTNALAVTQLWGVRSGASISLSHADILFNDDYFDFYESTSAGGDYHMGSIALHEFGHVLGLSHITDVNSPSESVMYPYLASSSEKTTLQSRDLAYISANYGITNSYTAQHQISGNEGRAITAALSDVKEGEGVSLVLELNAQGTCTHYLHTQDGRITGKVVHQHQVEVAHGHSH